MLAETVEDDPFVALVVGINEIQSELDHIVCLTYQDPTLDYLTLEEGPYADTVLALKNQLSEHFVSLAQRESALRDKLARLDRRIAETLDQRYVAV
jgi:hypothetical protein